MPSFSETDRAHMARALQLAARGLYSAHPNPMVGCVIAKNERVVGEGWHERAGEPHAEIHALAAAGKDAEGATAYVTLEPCAHHGKTPPCAEALLQAGINKVIAAMQDPFEQVAGRGLEMLAAAGVKTEVGLMQAAAKSLNAGFIARVTRNRPMVRVKVAASIDGATAMKSGESQWITGPEARDDVQRLRARSGAIMTGIGTVLADDPSLNVRLEDIRTAGLQPLRVVLDSRLRMPLSAGMLALPGETLVCCTGKHDHSRLSDAGAEVRSYAADGAVVDVGAVLVDLAQRGINDVLVEAGPGVAGYLLQKELVDELVIYQAPHIMGSETRGMFQTPSWLALADRKLLEISDVRRIGGDTRITARVRY
ncbi:MAG: bifunctional diaminohydroxyphosphoribosylaminopyrimidine deaminase/5-amino-6-(5-phosphoribosylamino)uracil reductase RibD [Gammaproteobacteria bacterium]|nr:bifunctional diaminohydroxyphosphoribosylaminopyrimidine deaminase/5-amino-6-(5-phosphoribosylamino)uracil reductase RibD [Gammaproteobacteria bacterium]NNL45257.1 bifunctional diaminohydroxyphosphoribosylaminopyrimidine deaminase/5-amino-6-(5-phosphoribosylamino)uracil reductase RibD [Woeseiaceae bacterium]